MADTITLPAGRRGRIKTRYLPNKKKQEKDDLFFNYISLLLYFMDASVAYAFHVRNGKKIRKVKVLNHIVVSVENTQCESAESG